MNVAVEFFTQKLRSNLMTIPHQVIKKAASGLALSAMVGLVGCSFLQSGPTSNAGVFSIHAEDSVALLPIANLTDVPQAGLRAESILEATLRSKGLAGLQVYPASLNSETLFEPSERKAQVEAEKWAQTQKIRYAITGSVTEWRYKVGVDGEPAVGLVVQIKDLSSGKIVWSSSGGVSGWSREALSAVAQKLTGQLLSTLEIQQKTVVKP